MKRLSMIVAISAAVLSRPAFAHDTTTAFASRGACESASAQMSIDEKDWLIASFPEYFDTTGDVSSFLTRAWTCDLNPSDGQYYITNHIQEILDSDWFNHRKPNGQ